MPKKEKKILAPTSARYLAGLTLEEDAVIRKAAKSLSLPKGSFIRAAAMKFAGECGYYLNSVEKPDKYSMLPPHKSAWAEVME